MILRNALALGALAISASVAGAQGNVITVTTSDFTFAAPDSIAGGLTTFALINKGTELHHMQIIRLEQGKTFADLQQAMKNPGPPPSWITEVGGPNAGVPDGRSAVRVTVALTPGNYVMLCFIPSPDGALHVMKGMVKPFTVTGAPAVTQAGEPKADVQMTLYDYNFDLDKPLTAGRHTIRVVNKASQAHEAFIAKLAPGTQATDFLEWMKAGMKGAPPVMPMGGVVGISRGQENLLTIDLTPGEYALYCFVPDAKDGKEHVQHGMFKQISVK